MSSPPESRGPDTALDPALPQKKRARRRLVGAAALCLAAAIALPLLFDSEPRQRSDELKVDIPSRDTPLPPPRSGAAGNDAGTPAGSTTTPATPAPSSSVSETRPAEPPVAPPARPAESKPEAKPPAEPKRANKAPEKPPEKGADKANKAGGESKRYVLQVGAFTSEKGASEQADKVKGSGLTAFTEKVTTAQGERIRVRVGPFPTREAAEQARGQLKLIGIDSALIAP